MRNDVDVSKGVSNKRRPRLVAIVGGSGAGKSWLAAQLEKKLGKGVVRLSLDDFYRDRSHLPLARREKINFDHPGAIDWGYVEKVLQNCLVGRTGPCPQYDFATHSRKLRVGKLKPKGIIIMDGLWLLRRPAIRRLFDCRIFLECPQDLRLTRRLRRDLQERGRAPAAIRKQFRSCVLPMHRKYVASQRRWANVVLDSRTLKEGIDQLVARLRASRPACPL